MIARGDVYWVNLEPSHPPEFGKTRPALVLSNSLLNAELPTVVVVPLSSLAPEIWPLRVSAGRLLKKPSFVVIPGIRQVHIKRLQQRITGTDSVLLQRVSDAVALYLSE